MSDLIPSFIFGGENTAIKTPEDLARKRALVDALLTQESNSPTPRNLGEGLGAIGKALMVRQARQGLQSNLADVQAGQDKLSPIITAAMNQQAAVQPAAAISQPAAQSGAMPAQSAQPVASIPAPRPYDGQGSNVTNASPIPAPVNPNMPAALTTGQQVAVPPPQTAAQVPQGAASGQLAALIDVANRPEFAFASPIKQKMVTDLIQTIQAQNNPLAQQNLAKGAIELQNLQHPENIQMTPQQKAMLDIYHQRTIPKGYIQDSDGNITYIPGGPADPTIIATNSEAKLPVGAIMDEATVDNVAKRVYLGDPKAMTNLGRGTQGAANVVAVNKRIAEITKENEGKPKPTYTEGDILLNQADQRGALSGATASGRLNAMMDTFANEANGAIDVGLNANRAVPRSNWMPINTVVQAIQRGSSDPALAQFDAANQAIVNTYSKAVTPMGQPTDSSRAKANALLATAQSPEAYEAVLQQLKREINIAHNAARNTRAAERAGTAQNDLNTEAFAPSAGSSSVGVGDYVTGGSAPASNIMRYDVQGNRIQ